MIEELNKLDQEEISWTDDVGQQVKSKIKMPAFLTDAVEKSLVMGHVAHNSKYSCPFCEIPGAVLKRDTHPKAFESHPLQKFKNLASKDVIPGGARYIMTIGEKKYIRRDTNRRLQRGVTSLERRLADKNKKKCSIRGTNGPPAIMNLKNFDETDSHLSDTLHVICQGVFKDMITKLLDGHGQDHNFARDASKNFSVFDNLQGQMSRCSECNRNCYPLTHFASWTAYDSLQFLLHSVALLCSDDLLFPSHEVYDVIRHLSNIVYLSHYGRLTEDIIQKVEREVKAFTKKFKDTFGEPYCTHKFHVMQHFPDFLRLHGNASLTDGFNMEKFNLEIRTLNRSTNQFGLENTVKNFILKYHGKAFDNIASFSPKVKRILKNLGVQKADFGSFFSDNVRKEHPIQSVPFYIKEAVINQIVKEGTASRVYADKNIRRVLSIHRKGMILDSKEVKKKRKSRVKDCFIQLEGKWFGEIEELFSIKAPDGNDNNVKLYGILREFREIQCVRNDNWGGVIEYPINQVPCLKPCDASEVILRPFAIEPHTFIQKAHVGKLSYQHEGQDIIMFTIRPNEWFRF